jgi:hypothetical protein
MGRKPRAATEGTETAPKPIVRRTRRRTTIDHAAQTHLLVNALLAVRGAEGASQADALAVVTWARGVHEEAAALKTLATRVRKVKAEGVAERQVAHEVNSALLNGVLSGAATINVGDDGSIIFGSATAAAPSAE